MDLGLVDIIITVVILIALIYAIIRLARWVNSKKQK